MDPIRQVVFLEVPWLLWAPHLGRFWLPLASIWVLWGVLLGYKIACFGFVDGASWAVFSEIPKLHWATPSSFILVFVGSFRFNLGYYQRLS